MIYNGFRRIALAHSLLPAAPVTQNGAETGGAAEHVLESAQHQQTAAHADAIDRLDAVGLGSL